jgi:hypothetical protein
MQKAVLIVNCLFREFKMHVDELSNCPKISEELYNIVHYVLCNQIRYGQPFMNGSGVNDVTYALPFFDALSAYVSTLST